MVGVKVEEAGEMEAGVSINELSLKQVSLALSYYMYYYGTTQMTMDSYAVT